MGVYNGGLEDGGFTLIVNGEEQWKRFHEFLEKYKPKTTTEFSKMLERIREEVEKAKRNDLKEDK